MWPLILRKVKQSVCGSLCSFEETLVGWGWSVVPSASVDPFELYIDHEPCSTSTLRSGVFDSSCLAKCYFFDLVLVTWIGWPLPYCQESEPVG